MKIVFMGTPAAAVPSLRRIVEDGHEVVAAYTQPDRPSGRGNKIAFSPVKQFALEHRIPVIQPTTLRTPEAFEEFTSYLADVVVVVAYGRILPASFLQGFPHGAINVHFSLLPKYRGAAPVNWAIVNGESSTGVTTMKMDTGLDTGDILLQSETMIGDNESSIELMDRLAVLGAEVLSETVANLGKIEPRAQDNAAATMAPIMKKEDGRIDWSMTAETILRRIRGFQPFPTTYTFLGDKRFTFWKAVSPPEMSHDVQSGSIISASSSGIEVACGDGTIIKVTELQMEGKKRMSAADIVNGGLILTGSRFD